MSPSVDSLPNPPAFLDPLTQIDLSYYYAVPKFFSQDHPNTRWLITMMQNGELDRLKRKMETSPDLFRTMYYQISDDPQLHNPEDFASPPMFRRNAVLYLTALGIAVYMGKVCIVELLLNYRDVFNEPLCSHEQVQYASHLQDPEVGDFHAFPIHVIMIRRACFSCAQALLKAGWLPDKPVAMPMRRKFERRVIYFRDWLDITLSVLASRHMFPIQNLLRELTNCKEYTPLKMQLEQFLSLNPATAIPIGIITIEELPQGVNMLGVRSLLDLTEHYDRYLQVRNCAREVATLKREAVALGLNPEVLMIQAQNFDPDAAEKDQNNGNARRARGANNSSIIGNVSDESSPQIEDINMNANSGTKRKRKVDHPYISEGCRILHFALMRDIHGKCLQVCIAAFDVLLQRNFYMTSKKLESDSPVARDARNMVCLLLNMLQREQNKVDTIVCKIKSGVKKFPHLEEHKQLENRKSACLQFMNKLLRLIATLLLQTKLLVHFVQSKFPLYSAQATNFPLNPLLAHRFDEVKISIIQEFNLRKDAWIYLDNDMIETVAGIPNMQMHFKVGKRPPQKVSRKGFRKSTSNKSNMTSTNSCSVTYTRVEPKRKKIKTVSSTASYSASVSNVISSAAQLLGENDTYEKYRGTGLPEQGSPDINTVEGAASLSDAPDLFDFAAATKNFAGLLMAANRPDSVDAHPESSVKPQMSENVASDGKVTSSAPTGMEVLLASLCREVDNLFRPLESPGGELGGGGGNCGGNVGAWTVSHADNAVWCTTADPTSSVQAVHSNIEPDLASTPKPTPEPTPALIHSSCVVNATDENARQVDTVSTAYLAPQPSVSCRLQQLQHRRKPSCVSRLFKRFSGRGINTGAEASSN